MYCANHPATPAVGACAGCGKPVCQNCAVQVDGRFLCKTCAGPNPAAPIARKRAVAPDPVKKDNVVRKISIIAAIAIVGVAALAFIGLFAVAVIMAFVLPIGPTGTGTSTTYHTAPPAFTVQGYSNSTVTVTLVDMGGAKSIKGLSIPTLEQPTIVDPDTELVVGQTITIDNPKFTDPGKKHLVGVSTVDGKEMTVFDMYTV